MSNITSGFIGLIVFLGVVLIGALYRHRNDKHNADHPV